MKFGQVATAAIIAFASTSLIVQPVSATGGGYGWRNCNWENSLSVNDGTIWVRASGYPADGWGDGVLNSFNNRINQAIQTWDNALAQAGYTWPVEIARTADNASSEDIWVHRQAFSNADLWGSAAVYAVNGANSCLMHSTSNNRIIWAEVQTREDPDWFTQEDSRRAYWEGCPGRNYVPTYTCSKFRDFEGVLVHELGHALGLPHPNDVYLHQTSLNPSPNTLANCASTTDYASMCGPEPWRSTAQTLHFWDRESFRLIEVKH